jgi:hypothetical protein
MARTALTVNQITRAGLVFSPTAANADGHRLTGIEGMFVDVNNASGGSLSVTMKTPAQKGGLDIAEDVITIANGQAKVIGGNWDKEIYRQSDRTLHIDFSTVSSVTVAAFYAGSN